MGCEQRLQVQYIQSFANPCATSVCRSIRDNIISAPYGGAVPSHKQKTRICRWNHLAESTTIMLPADFEIVQLLPCLQVRGVVESQEVLLATRIDQNGYVHIAPFQIDYVVVSEAVRSLTLAVSWSTKHFHRSPRVCCVHRQHSAIICADKENISNTRVLHPLLRSKHIGMRVPLLSQVVIDANATIRRIEAGSRPPLDIGTNFKMCGSCDSCIIRQINHRD
mmetsp:Transcript_29659/g.69027  ORF Transcript_29659/g.69027 Transcript_29659/m.69027 type:complete len:222 (-) Transcript_29659:259-924(-)